MEIKITQTGGIETNAYLIIDRDVDCAVLVDPGDESIRLIEWIEKLNIKLKAILVTHGHFDHIGAVDAIKNHFQVPVLTHQIEAETMQDSSKNLSLFFMQKNVFGNATQFIEDGEMLDFGGKLKFRCIIVPGHTAKSVCYYNTIQNFIMTGDTLMAGSIGRTDLYAHNNEHLVQNIKSKIFSLPEETVVFPGHGHKTKVEIEKATNPYFY